MDSSTDIIAVGRNALQELAVYTVTNAAGIVSTVPLVTASSVGAIQLQAMSWDAASKNIAVGVAATSPQNALQVFTFDSAVPSLSLTASATLGAHSGLAVSWNQAAANTALLAVGLSFDMINPLDQLVQTFSFIGGSSLSYVCGINGFSRSVDALDWNPKGTCLGVGLSGSGQFSSYYLNQSGQSSIVTGKQIGRAHV